MATKKSSARTRAQIKKFIGFDILFAHIRDKFNLSEIMLILTQNIGIPRQRRSTVRYLNRSDVEDEN